MIEKRTGNQLARVAYRTTVDDTIPPAERNDRWLTPLPIIESLTTDRPVPYKTLPMFDLDPAASPDWPTAKKILTLENGDDGLADPWFGRVWMNPPYGRTIRKWTKRFLDFYNEGAIAGGTWLVPCSMGTKLWQDDVLPNATAIHFWRHRINFVERTEGLGRNMVSIQASGIVAFGDLDADALTTSGLPGTCIDFRVG